MATNSTLLHWLTRQLQSVKIAVAGLLLLCLVSGVGAFIPQGKTPDEYVNRFGPTWSSLLEALGFTDVYHCWWFTALLAWIFFSMLACSVHRLRALLKARDKADVFLEPAAYEKKHSYARLSCLIRPELQAKTLADDVETLLQESSYTIEASRQEGARTMIAAAKGNFGRFSSLIVHCGTSIVLLGGALTTMFGIVHRLEIPVGDEARIPGTSCVLRLQDFRITYYPGADRQPKEYLSKVSLEEPGHAPKQADITVNTPMSVAGFRFFQMSYTKHAESVTVRVTKKDTGATVGEFVLPLEKPTFIPEMKRTLKATNFISDFVIGRNGEPQSKSQNFDNPAVKVEVYVKDELKGSSWIFEEFPSYSKMHEKKDALYSLEFARYNSTFSSGLRVTRDPGMVVVYVGFFLLVVGTFFGCYVFPRHIWIDITEGDDGAVVLQLAGQAPKNRLDFAREFEKITSGLQAICNRLAASPDPERGS